MTAKKKKTAIFIVTVMVLITAIAIVSIRTVRDYLRESYEEIERQILLSTHPILYSELVEKYANEWNNELDIYFIYAVIKTESDFNPNAVSSADARGLMQLTEDTFDWISRYRFFEPELEFDIMFDPETNARFGTWFLSYLYDSYTDRNAVIAAYHAGYYAVREWLQDERYTRDGIHLIVENIPIADTRHYVNKVNNAYNNYIKLYVTQTERN